MPKFENGQTVWYLRPGMATPMEMTYLGTVYEESYLIALLANVTPGVVMTTLPSNAYARQSEALDMAGIWVRDRVTAITVELRLLEKERANLLAEVSNE